MTHTHIYIVIYREPILSPKIEGRQPDSPAVTGGTMGCHNDNPGCHQRQPSRQIDDPPSSMVTDEYDTYHLNFVIWCHVFCERTCNVFPGDYLGTRRQRIATLPACRHPRHRRLSFWQPAMPPATTKSAPQQLSVLNGRTWCGDICCGKFAASANTTIKKKRRQKCNQCSFISMCFLMPMRACRNAPEPIPDRSDADRLGPISDRHWPATASPHV